jgi:hypothetical protein
MIWNILKIILIIHHEFKKLGYCIEDLKVAGYTYILYIIATIQKLQNAVLRSRMILVRLWLRLVEGKMVVAAPTPNIRLI